MKFTVIKANKQPCEPYPEDAHVKSIAVRCPDCETCDCWKAYLVWERRVCPDFAAERERKQQEAEAKERASVCVDDDRWEP